MRRIRNHKRIWWFLRRGLLHRQRHLRCDKSDEKYLNYNELKIVGFCRGWCYRNMQNIVHEVGDFVHVQSLNNLILFIIGLFRTPAHRYQYEILVQSFHCFCRCFKNFSYSDLFFAIIPANIPISANPTLPPVLTEISNSFVNWTVWVQFAVDYRQRKRT